MLKLHFSVTLFMTVVFMSACDRSTSWPPHQRQLIRLFDQQKATLVLIEQEMEADGIIRMGPGIFSDSNRSAGVPFIPSVQKNKYVDLFGRTQVYLYVVRNRNATEFELLIQNDESRLFVPRFVHTNSAGTLRRCSDAMEQMACGGCFVSLESGWLLEFDWFPANPDEEARLC